MDRPADSQAATYAATLPTGSCTDTLPGLPIEEAARALGVSSSTIRRWVREGRLRSERIARPQGYTVRVHLPDQVSSQLSDQPPTQLPEQQVSMWTPDHQRAEAMAAYSRSLLEPLVAELGQARQQIAAQAEQVGRQAGRIAQLEAQLAETQERIRTLEAPQAPEPAPEPPTSTPAGQASAPWWRRWWGWLASEPPRDVAARGGG